MNISIHEQIINRLKKKKKKTTTDGIIYDLLASGTHSGDRGITLRQLNRPPLHYSCRSTNKYVVHVERLINDFSKN